MLDGIGTAHLHLYDPDTGPRSGLPPGVPRDGRRIDRLGDDGQPLPQLLLGEGVSDDAVDDYGDRARVYRKVLAVEPFQPAPTE